MRRLLASALVLSLAACGAGGVIADYGSVKPVTFVQGGVDWKAYDRADGRVMLAPTVASIKAAGKTDKWADPALFQSAAQAWLAPRGCTVGAVKPMMMAQMEVTYSC